VARDALAIDKGAVTAVEILKDIVAVFGDDAGMRSRGPVVAQNQVIIGLAADQKR